MGCASLAGRGRVALGVLAALVLAWATLSLTPAQASPWHGNGVGCGPDGQRGVASSELPRRLEADLPDPVSGAVPLELDPDLAAARRIAVAAFTAARPCATLQPCAAPAARARAFDPRAPPLLR